MTAPNLTIAQAAVWLTAHRVGAKWENVGQCDDAFRAARDQNNTMKTSLSSHPQYNTWKKMRDRCNNPRSTQFAYYGGRGIAVCERWDSFALFIEDMGGRPSPDHTLDRIDNDKGYSPDNCRWTTKAQQNANRSNAIRVHVSAYGEMCGAEAARLLGISKRSFYRRLKRVPDA